MRLVIRRLEWRKLQRNWDAGTGEGIRDVEGDWAMRKVGPDSQHPIQDISIKSIHRIDNFRFWSDYIDATDAELSRVRVWWR